MSFTVASVSGAETLRSVPSASRMLTSHVGGALAKNFAVAPNTIASSGNSDVSKKTTMPRLYHAAEAVK